MKRAKGVYFVENSLFYRVKPILGHALSHQAKRKTREWLVFEAPV
jgi:hypothetical protein